MHKEEYYALGRAVLLTAKLSSSLLHPNERKKCAEPKNLSINLRQTHLFQCLFLCVEGKPCTERWVGDIQPREGVTEPQKHDHIKKRYRGYEAIEFGYEQGILGQMRTGCKR
ncbi:hypothetical protein Ddc_12728 [Ditylenchus destructor]|nr:hypothetical protein Ddc_12728 [Ditylenchus destructor]